MSEPAPLKISSYAEFMVEAERLDPEGFALHRDAARWRWFRQWWATQPTTAPFGIMSANTEAEVDAAVDEAMRAKTVSA
jgi:hypothetical protein